MLPGLRPRAVLLAALLAGAAAGAAPLPPCEGEAQQAACGDIPWAFTLERSACCSAHAAAGAAPAGRGGGDHRGVAAAAAAEEDCPNAPPPELPPRGDLAAAASGAVAMGARYRAAPCVRWEAAHVPAFGPGAPRDVAALNAITQDVPLLDPGAVRRVKDEALRRLAPPQPPGGGRRRGRAPAGTGGDSAGGAGAPRSPLSSVWQRHQAWAATAPPRGAAGLHHPASTAGLAELAWLQHRLANGASPQAPALEQLLSGAGVPPKRYDGCWAPPTGCPADYDGPFPMRVASIRYGGLNDPALGACAPNYPAAAPPALCGHVSFVELDGQMVFKQALAFWATGNAAHAQIARRIFDGWAATNVQIGPALDGNGALEAAWGCASFARAVELLRSHPAWPAFGGAESYTVFVGWLRGVLLPPTDAWVAFKDPPASLGGWDGNVYSNWHASIAECWVAAGVVADDRGRYDAGVQLFHRTVAGFLKWGRGRWAEGGRLIGETTETLRDIYHTLFGLGGLLQAAEAAWQATDDASLYASGGHALAAALEVHAAIVLAGPYGNASALPPGFAPYDAMPPPPPGCVWRINLGSQLWGAVNASTGAWLPGGELRDGVKYLLGVKHIPVFELGYNHYAGRLGMALPQTRALLERYWPEHYELQWGSHTLTHAGSAATLWAPGVKPSTLCPGAADPPAEEPQPEPPAESPPPPVPEPPPPPSPPELPPPPPELPPPPPELPPPSPELPPETPRGPLPALPLPGAGEPRPVSLQLPAGGAAEPAGVPGLEARIVSSRSTEA
ncbi:hypothetical protein HT031_003528 [Scenedesmus sp. PABB004]|nr:hypothetical protein HT031_003528 [Scenedesmus sp. PABB004]